MKKIWKAKAASSGASVREILLQNRGLDEAGKIRDFLDPRYEHSPDPFLLCDMDKAVARIKTAFARQEKITVYADYDADAVTAAAVIVRFLTHLGHKNIDVYIPDRFAEGYGVNQEAVKVLAESGTNLIITVDCGINAFDSIDLATYLGLDVIVTDHHQLTGGIPRALAVLNPHRPDDGYPFKDLTGVGVAFKLAQALARGQARAGWEKWLLDLVAIGTVADCQTLLGENRIFVKWGLQVMRKTKWPGLRALLDRAGIADVELDTYKIGFIVAPRINAAGRIEHANLALELLTSDESRRVADLSLKLEELNRHRQELTAQILSEAREQLAASGEKKILLAAGKGWPRGIVGLVAGKLTEEFFRPVLVLDEGKIEATGSARSIGNFNIIEAISESRDILLKFGGHPMAAGFTLRSEHIALFHKNLLVHADKILHEDDLNPVLQYEATIRLSDITPGLLELLEQFAPFGQGNPRPRFRIDNVVASFFSAIGTEGKHLRLQISDGPVDLNCIGFGLGYWAVRISVGERLDLVCEPQYNDWNGQRKIQLKILDLDLHAARN